MSMFLIGERVERRADGAYGVIREVIPGTDEHPVMYRVELRRHQGTTDDNTVIGAEGAWRRFVRVHAHVVAHSADCDGSYERTHVDVPSALERISDFGDLEFKERVLAGVVTLTGNGTLRVKPEGVAWDETTEEGYRHVDVTWCDEDCSTVPSFRDFRAESMGY